MSIFDKVASAFNTGRAELTTQISRYKNKKFMQGTVSVCAYIAMASDGAGATEKQKMMGFIKSSKELKVFSAAEVIDFFNKITASFDFDLDIGKGEAMVHILALKDDAGAAQLAMRVGIAVAKSDGDFDAQEKKAAKEICQALGLDPAEHQL